MTSSPLESLKTQILQLTEQFAELALEKVEFKPKIVLHKIKQKNIVK